METIFKLLNVMIKPNILVTTMIFFYEKSQLEEMICLCGRIKKVFIHLILLDESKKSKKETEENVRFKAQ